MGSSPGKSIPSRGDRGSGELDDFEKLWSVWLERREQSGCAGFRSGRAWEAAPRTPGFIFSRVLRQGRGEDWGPQLALQGSCEILFSEFLIPQPQSHSSEGEST